VKDPLPERRLVVRAGPCVLALDLTQIRDVTGAVAGGVALLSQVLGLAPEGPGVAVLMVETGGRAVAVAVDAVGGVVEVPRRDQLALGPHVLLQRRALLRGVLRVPEPSAWRGRSLVPVPAAQLALPSSTGRLVLAVDVDPVELGRLLLAEGNTAVTP
jgi:hypothetical protein